MTKVKQDEYTLIVDSISSSGIELLSDTIEMGVDSVLNDGVLKDVPVIGSLVKIISIGKSIRDQLFARKIMTFLLHLKDLPTKERENLISQIEDKKKEEIGEVLLLNIEQLNDIDKTEFTAKIFVAFLYEIIDLLTLKRFLNIINVAPVIDLKHIDKSYSSNSSNNIQANSINERLLGYGLLKIIGMGNENWETHFKHNFFNYDYTEDGKLLSSILDKSINNISELKTSEKRKR